MKKNNNKTKITNVSGVYLETTVTTSKKEKENEHCCKATVVGFTDRFRMIVSHLTKRSLSVLSPRGMDFLCKSVIRTL